MADITSITFVLLGLLTYALATIQMYQLLEKEDQLKKKVSNSA